MLHRVRIAHTLGPVVNMSADEADGPGVVLIAHEACYRLWQEESVIQSVAQTGPTCRYCGRPIRGGEHRYREPGGDAHVVCRDTALRRRLQ
jgi:hypothetical protein